MCKILGERGFTKLVVHFPLGCVAKINTPWPWPWPWQLEFAKRAFSTTAGLTSSKPFRDSHICLLRILCCYKLPKIYNHDRDRDRDRDCTVLFLSIHSFIWHLILFISWTSPLRFSQLLITVFIVTTSPPHFASRSRTRTQVRSRYPGGNDDTKDTCYSNFQKPWLGNVQSKALRVWECGKNRKPSDFDVGSRLDWLWSFGSLLKRKSGY
jgi:hypothetical protein